MKSLLLVCAANDHDVSAWTYEQMPAFLNKRAFVTPLHLATVAAMTPKDIDVAIWDEHIRGPVDDCPLLGTADLVGVTAFSVHLRRARVIARLARSKGRTVVIGGPGVTAAPETCMDDFDHLFIGETESTWGDFIADFRRGEPKQVYRSTELPDMSSSPRPRWDSIRRDLPAYVTGGVQVSRGCPFNCEFCSVWQVFGRKMRTKDIEQVIDEIRTLERLGIGSVLFCADNFFGTPKYAKALLRRVIEMNDALARRLLFSAELDINIARDPEMLELLAEANFSSLLIGIETPNVDSLKESRKRMNLRGDLVMTCRTIQSYGVPIDGSIIVGFDHDSTAIFQEQFDFLQAACIPLPKMHMLKAIAGTELRTRLEVDGRVVNVRLPHSGTSDDYLDAAVHTNILPALMSREELMTGYIWLLEEIFDWENFENRIAGFVDNVSRKPLRSADANKDRTATHVRGAIVELNPVAREAIIRILDRTESVAPFMLPSVARLSLRHVFESGRVAVIRKELEAQIRYEASHPAVPA
jgi:Radical SAM superfamily/Domain of unknown function (DUF4070)